LWYSEPKSERDSDNDSYGYGDSDSDGHIDSVSVAIADCYGNGDHWAFDHAGNSAASYCDAGS
jgi:hypothetical protein